MEKFKVLSDYLNCINVAVAGDSGVGKSTLFKIISARLKFIDTTPDKGGQNTVTPTVTIIDQDLDVNRLIMTIYYNDLIGSHDVKLKLLEVFTFVYKKFIENGNKSTLQLSAIKKYVESGRFTEDLITSVSGVVRLTQFKDDEKFIELSTKSGLELLSSVDPTELDSQLAKLNGEKEKINAQINYVTGKVKDKWSEVIQFKDSIIQEFVFYTYNRVINMVEYLVGKKLDKLKELLKERVYNNVAQSHVEEYSETIEFILSDSNHRKIINEIHSPRNPYSLILKKIVNIQGMDDKLLNAFKKHKGFAQWMNKGYRVRFKLTDTPGLSQLSGSTMYEREMSLKEIINLGVDAILLLKKHNVSTDDDKTLSSLFSYQNETGREIRDRDIQLYIGISQSDEIITKSDASDMDDYIFVDVMKDNLADIEKIESETKKSFKAEKVCCITTKPKNVSIYIDELIIRGQQELAGNFSSRLSEEAIYEYLVDILFEIQLKRFYKDGEGRVNPFFYVGKENAWSLKLKYNEQELVERVEAMRELVKIKYVLNEHLYWSTAEAFIRSLRTGVRFISKAVVNGRISIYVDGDIEGTKLNDLLFSAIEFQGNNIDLSHPSSSTFLEHLKLTTDDVADQNKVNIALTNFLVNEFTKDNRKRLYNVMYNVRRALSYSYPVLREKFETKLQNVYGYNNMVQAALNVYQEYYNSDEFIAHLKEVIRDEYTKEFNKMFYPINK
ncbi:hypothetical protein ACFSTH_11535 [Paenibacillus yanchengensis]|uniref:Uncharacterized protein n=1 Tax=Paenibacillus yanchengensis TaxID=2035833 RepID=A0ABW4YPJ7_9BACL